MPFGQACPVSLAAAAAVPSGPGLADSAAVDAADAVDAVDAVDAAGAIALRTGVGAAGNSGRASAASGSSGRPAQAMRQLRSAQAFKVLARVTLKRPFYTQSGVRTNIPAGSSVQSPAGIRSGFPFRQSGRRLRRVEHDVRHELFQAAYANALHS
jgi:hypothetical protein